MTFSFDDASGRTWTKKIQGEQLENWRAGNTLKYPAASYRTPGGNYTENSPMLKPQRNSYFSILEIQKLSPLTRGWQYNSLPSSGLGSPSLSILKIARVILWASSEKWSPLQTSKKYLLCLSVSLSYWVPESLSIWQGEVSMSEWGLWNSRPVQLPSLCPQTWSGLHIPDIFQKHFLSCCLSPHVKLGREETVSAILDLKLMTYLRLQKVITKLGITHRYNIVCLT